MGRVRHCLCMVVSGSLVAAGFADGTIRLFTIEAGRSESPHLRSSPDEPLARLTGHTGSISALLFYGATPARLLSASRDMTVRVWDTEKHSLVAVLAGHTAAITCIDCHSATDRFARGAEDGSICTWSLDEMSCLSKIQGHDGYLLLKIPSLLHSPIMTSPGRKKGMYLRCKSRRAVASWCPEARTAMCFATGLRNLLTHG